MRSPKRTLSQIFANFSGVAVGLAFAIAVCSKPQNSSAASLSIQVENIRSANSNVIVAIYDSAATFLDMERHVIIAEPADAAGPIEVVFDDLPPGDYAVAAYHDENASGEFDTNFLGLPEEGYGFSNGTQAGLGPPDFEEAAVKVGQGTTRTAMPLNY